MPAENEPEPTSFRKRQPPKKSPEDTAPLPDPFPLPSHFSAAVEMALSSKSMTTTTRRGFVGKVAASMLCYKRYPTREDYENVGRAIIEKYPFLRSPAGSPAVSIMIHVM